MLTRIKRTAAVAVAIPTFVAAAALAIGIINHLMLRRIMAPESARGAGASKEPEPMIH